MTHNIDQKLIQYKEPTWILLTLCYPPTPTKGWGVDEHTDLGFLTILNQDQIGGLEVKVSSRLSGQIAGHVNKTVDTFLLRANVRTHMENGLKCNPKRTFLL